MLLVERKMIELFDFGFEGVEVPPLFPQQFKPYTIYKEAFLHKNGEYHKYLNKTIDALEWDYNCDLKFF